MKDVSFCYRDYDLPQMIKNKKSNLKEIEMNLNTWRIRLH